MVHRIVVEDQSLWWYGRPPKIADNSIEFVQFQFHLSEDWEPLLLVAQFTQADTYNMLLKDGKCFLPVELIAGLCKVSLFGYTEGKPLRATSIPLIFEIEKSGFVSSAETPIPPTPDLYAQLLERIAETGAGNLDPEVVAKAVEDYLEKNPPSGGVQFKPDNTLILKDGVLSVNTTDRVEQDNTLPITSAGVNRVVGNIGAILDTI